MHHQNLIVTVLAAALTVAGCMPFGMGRDLGPAYEPGTLNRITVQVVYPDGMAIHAGAKIFIMEISGESSYALEADAQGRASTLLVHGIYRITARESSDGYVFNATRNNVIISGEDVSLTIELKKSKPGAVVIKEIYNGGCPKLPKEGTYQSDQYILLHNNSADTYCLDGLCMGTLSPYNSYGSNPWLQDGDLPAFLPIIQAVLMIPGDGDDFPLEPGADALVCLRGAIDHTQEFPMSVNLNRSDAFVCYDPVLFPNVSYHPAPGSLVDPARYLEIVIKTGQANAYTLSVSSPAFVLFRPPQDTDIHDWVKQAEHLPQVPGGTEQVVAIPPEWVVDGVEVFYGGSSGNKKRLPETVDAGSVTLSENFKGHSLIRKEDTETSQAVGYTVFMDSNNSSEDFYERQTQTLHED